MAMEIELKAHVGDPEALKAAISLLTGCVPLSFEKDDCYWAALDCVPKSGAPYPF